MKLFNVIFLLYAIFTITTLPLFSDQKAVISVPIADLLGQQITTIIPNSSAENAYASIAVCGGNIKVAFACPRLHQLLYNEIVDVLKTTDEEVCIQTTHAYYLTQQTKSLQNQYWTLKKNITYIDDLTAHHISASHVPEAIDFSDKNYQALTNANIITLIEPHHDSTLRLTFSAGTRFVKTDSPRKKRASTIEVFAVDFLHLKPHKIKIPLHKCITTHQIKTNQEHMTDFINVLKKWSHCKQGFIPYVWGGTSFVKPIHTHFKEVTKTGHNGDYSFYEYEKNALSPKNGFDCSGLILRAAQITGIPYFCKNTTTIEQCLAPLTTEQQLQAGDLILIKGHVMVVADITKNTLIEARSYGHGYGKLHEIPINQVFEGIETYKDLYDVYCEKKAVKRKDKDGKIRDTFSNLQLFSMMSVWNK